MHAHSLSRLLAASLALALCLAPQAASAAARKDRVTAVSAPSPYSQEADPAAAYRSAAQRRWEQQREEGSPEADRPPADKLELLVRRNEERRKKTERPDWAAL